MQYEIHKWIAKQLSYQIISDSFSLHNIVGHIIERGFGFFEGPPRSYIFGKNVKGVAFTIASNAKKPPRLYICKGGDLYYCKQCKQTPDPGVSQWYDYIDDITLVT